jgi:hypothetical protein
MPVINFFFLYSVLKADKNWKKCNLEKPLKIFPHPPKTTRLA